LPTVEDLEIYRIVFELFDRSKIGQILMHEMLSIVAKLGYDPASCNYLFLTVLVFKGFNDEQL